MAVIAIAAAVLAVALFQTRNLPLIDRDEGRYAEAARELRASGDWLVPRLYGVAYLEKPPFFYWVTASAYALVGEDELGARLAPAVAAALGVLATGLFAVRYLRGRAGVLAAATLASSGLYFVFARVVVTDMLFTALLASALMAFFVADRERRSFLPFWLLAAAATLTKGPVAAVLCALVILTHLAVERRLPRIFAADFLGGLAVYLPIVGTWLFLLETRFPGFIGFYIYKEHVLRAAGDEHWEAFWWYAPWLLVGFLPWTPAWVAALPGSVRAMRADSTHATALRFTALWAGAIFVFFSIPRGKLVPYILPIFPALAIQLGDALDQWIAGDRAIPGIRFAFLGLGVVLFAAASSLPIVAHLSPVVVPRSTVAAAVVFGLAVAIVVLVTHHRRDATPVAAIAAAIGLLQCVGAAIAAPIVRPLTATPVIEILRERMTAQDAFAAYGGYFPNVPFYLRRIPYFVAGNRELDFGISLEGNGPWVVDDLEALWKRIGRRHTFFLLRTRDRDLDVLLALPGKAALVHRGRTSSLVEVEP
jgi:4-amino-4-deoxy-L-arabinose transferase-like glycosyltransferase